MLGAFDNIWSSRDVEMLLSDTLALVSFTDSSGASQFETAQFSVRSRSVGSELNSPDSIWLSSNDELPFASRIELVSLVESLRGVSPKSTNKSSLEWFSSSKLDAESVSATSSGYFESTSTLLGWSVSSKQYFCSITFWYSSVYEWVCKTALAVGG